MYCRTVISYKKLNREPDLKYAQDQDWQNFITFCEAVHLFCEMTPNTSTQWQNYIVSHVKCNCVLEHSRSLAIQNIFKDVQFAGVFGKAGEIQTNLCLAFGPNDITYSGTLSGEIYRWKGHNLAGTIPHAHTVSIMKIVIPSCIWNCGVVLTGVGHPIHHEVKGEITRAVTP